MIELETRPFEARFGTRCPFCGRTWGDPRPCGDSRADWTIRDGLRLLFADRVAECVVCGKQMAQGRKRCFDCAESVVRYQNREASARYKERHAKPKTCEGCGEGFMAKKPTQRFCGYSCGNARPKQYCVRGHDTHVVGRNKKSGCRQCERDSARLRKQRQKVAA